MNTKQLCPNCKVGKETYSLDPHSPFCPYIDFHNGYSCGRFESFEQEHNENIFLKRMMYVDSMTGVYNRNAYEEEMERLRDDKSIITNLTVIAVDLNNTTEIDYNYGHHMRDEAIKHLAMLLKSAITQNGRIYTVGHGEFVCLVKSENMDYISDFRKQVLLKEKVLPYPFSVSIGYVGYDDVLNNTIDVMIRRSNLLMQDEKKKICM